MNFKEAVTKTFPAFDDAIAAHPNHLIILGVIPENPADWDGPGKVFIVGAPDIAALPEIQEYVDVLYYYWAGFVIRPQDGAVYMQVDLN